MIPCCNGEFGYAGSAEIPPDDQHRGRLDVFGETSSRRRSGKRTGLGKRGARPQGSADRCNQGCELQAPDRSPREATDPWLQFDDLSRVGPSPVTRQRDWWRSTWKVEALFRLGAHWATLLVDDLFPNAHSQTRRAAMPTATRSGDGYGLLGNRCSVSRRHHIRLMLKVSWVNVAPDHRAIDYGG
jgi:hypothetical protein